MNAQPDMLGEAPANAPLLILQLREGQSGCLGLNRSGHDDAAAKRLLTVTTRALRKISLH